MYLVNRFLSRGKRRRHHRHRHFVEDRRRRRHSTREKKKKKKKKYTGLLHAYTISVYLQTTRQLMHRQQNKKKSKEWRKRSWRRRTKKREREKCTETRTKELGFGLKCTRAQQRHSLNVSLAQLAASRMWRTSECLDIQSIGVCCVCVIVAEPETHETTTANASHVCAPFHSHRSTMFTERGRF